MFLDKLFKAIGTIFTGLFGSAKKTWKKLSPEVQNAMLHGSQVVETINSNIDASPAFIIELLAKKFPDLTKEKLHEGLGKVAVALKLAQEMNSDDLLTLIQTLQTYLGSLKGKVWAAISHSIASVFAIVVAPAATKFAAISSLMEFVYHTFIKKDKEEKEDAE